MQERLNELDSKLNAQILRLETLGKPYIDIRKDASQRTRVVSGATLRSVGR